jgi:hypothetical protein
VLVRIQQGFEHYFERGRNLYRGLLSLALAHTIRIVRGVAALCLAPFLGQNFPELDSGAINPVEPEGRCLPGRLVAVGSSIFAVRLPVFYIRLAAGFAGDFKSPPPHRPYPLLEGGINVYLPYFCACERLCGIDLVWPRAFWTGRGPRRAS